MSTSFPSFKSKFVGREAEIARFKARSSHFSLFVLEGLRGQGKTALALQMAKEAKVAGCEGGLYLRLEPGETVSSIKSRIEARIFKKNAAVEQVSDDFQGLVGLLKSKKLALVLDSFENIRRDDIVPLVRTLAHDRGPYVVIAATSSEVPVSAMLRQQIAWERIGGFNLRDLEAYAKEFKLADATRDRLMAEARRRGAGTQPLILRWMTSLFGNDLLPDEVLQTQRGRSEHAFRAFYPRLEEKLSEPAKQALRDLVSVGAPLGLEAAEANIGPGVRELVKLGLVDVIDDAIHVHSLVASVLRSDEVELSKSSVAKIAKALKAQADESSEPAALARGAALLASIGESQGAVSMLAEAWDEISQLGFMESYLKALAAIQTDDAELKSRIALLSAKARMTMGNPNRLREPLQELTKNKDEWTKVRALAALTELHLLEHDYEGGLKTYKQLEALATDKNDSAVVRNLGPGVAEAMIHTNQIKPADDLLTQLAKSEKDKAGLGRISRLRARLSAQAGDLAGAVKYAERAAAHYLAVGELARAGESFGYAGDIHRESGEFDAAREAYGRFKELAEQAGEDSQSLTAMLAQAWVALDIGDITTAANLMGEVDSNVSVAAQPKLKLHLQAAKAMLAAGRGQHKAACGSLEKVMDAWDGTHQPAMADRLRAQLVRSSIASGKLGRAAELLGEALGSVNKKQAPSRAATFMREQGVLQLRDDEVAAAKTLEESYKLFVKGSNRREAAVTLHRIAHVLLDRGDEAGAQKRIDECLSLAKEIKHRKAEALGLELQGRLFLGSGQHSDAVDALKEAGKIFKELGDEVGLLHVSEVLLRAQIAAGEIAGALRNAPRVKSLAERLEVDEISRRAQALAGAAALRRQKVADAKSAYEAYGPRDASPLTRSIMWRLGEALALLDENRKVSLQCRGQWVEAVRALPERHQERGLKALEQLGMPPSDRLHLKMGKKVDTVSSEYAGFLDPSEYDLFVDILNRRVYAGGELVSMPSAEVERALQVLVANVGKVVPTSELYRAAMQKDSTKPDKKVASLVAALKKALGRSKKTKIDETKTGVKLVPPTKHALLVPTYLTPGLERRQREIIQLLGRLGVAQAAVLQEAFDMTRPALKNEISPLQEMGLIESVRVGRGQAFRLV